MASTIRGHIREALRGFSTDSTGEGPPKSANHIRALERKVINLQGQVVDLHSRIIEAEQKAAIEKRKKLGYCF